MPSLTSAQAEERVSAVRAALSCSSDHATSLLRRNSWDTSRAIHAHLDDAVSDADAARLVAWFDSLRDLSETTRDEAGNEIIGIEGILALAETLGVTDPESDPLMLALAWRLRAQQNFCFTKAEFVQGMKSANVFSESEAKTGLRSALEAALGNPITKKLVYDFSFPYSLPPGRKLLSKDVAVALWRILLTPEFALLNEWCTFLVQKCKQGGVNLDLWKRLYAFATTVHPETLEGYDEDGAWPSVIDDFVAYIKAERKKAKA